MSVQGGQICVVKVFNPLGSEQTKYRVMFLNSSNYGRNIDYDACMTAKWGTSLPPALGEAWIESIGIPCDIQVR
jgi:hypothetical protein